MNGVLNTQKISHLWPHTVFVLSEDGRENRKIVARHFVRNFVESVDEFGVGGVRPKIKYGCLQTLCHNIVLVQNFLG